MIPLDHEIDERGCALWVPVPRPGGLMQDLAAALGHIGALGRRCRAAAWRCCTRQEVLGWAQRAVRQARRALGGRRR